jgi:DNA-binding transcriptional ArsR family regulator
MIEETTTLTEVHLASQPLTAPEERASTPAARGQENVRAVGRALDILLAFSARDAQLSAGELVKRVGLSRPTLYRLLYTLEQNGFIVSEGEPLRFRLGPAVGQLSQVWLAGADRNASPGVSDSDLPALPVASGH